MVAVDEAGAAEFARAAEREGLSVDDPHLRGFVDRVAGLAKIALLVAGEMDEDYLRTLADRLGIRDRLDRSLGPSDRP